MPRGIPNAKKDDLGMKYTNFHVPLQLVYLLRNCNLLPLTYDRISLRSNPKLTASNYLKYESQSVWVRNAANRNRERGPEDTEVSMFVSRYSLQCSF